MTRRWMVLTALLVVGLFSGCDEGSSDAQPVARAGSDAVDAVATGLTTEARAVFESDRDVRCVARGIVDELGVTRLRDLGLDPGRQDPPRLFVPHLRESERAKVGAAYDRCLELRRSSIEGYMDGGLSEAEAACVTDSYRGSGIAVVHLTEAPHGVSKVDTEPARRHLDEFLQATERACRDWF